MRVKLVVETEDTIYLVETKAADQLTHSDVLDKMQAAIKYCQYASSYTSKNSGKAWKYLLIPHNEVSQSSGFEYLVNNFEGN